VSEDVELTEGEEVLYCLNCDVFLPCDCDGIPRNTEIRVYGGEDE